MPRTQEQNQPKPANFLTNNSPIADITYEKPPVGTNNVLSLSQIRWVLKEGIRIDTMRELVVTNEAIDEFNKIVDDYNNRGASFRYRERDLQRARREVEANRGQIVTEAIDDARRFERSRQPQGTPKPQAAYSNSLPAAERKKYIEEIQQLLTDLGYDTNGVDGKVGRDTTTAVKAFQKDSGLKQDGKIDQNLIDSLRKRKH
jgi:hypothetical protein